MNSIGSDNICFADFEFTCGFYDDKARSELLSVGLVFCSADHTVLETFYRTVRPCIRRKLTKQCRKLTKLTQEEIDASVDSDIVMAEVMRLVKKHGISEIGVWGNFDRPGLLSDIRQHARAGLSAPNVSKVLRLVRDIQNETIRAMNLPQAINIKDLASAFGYVPESGTFHNALNDAMALYTVSKAVHTTDIFSCEGFLALRQQRLDKIEADKRAAEERRRQLTLLIPFTPREQTFFGKLTSEADREDYLRLRFRIMNMFQRFPSEESFKFIIRHAPRRTGIAAASKFDPNRYPGADVIDFDRTDFDRILLSESRRRQPV
ncbi:MAG: hypothetical protein IKP47_00660 [Ruminococcus sp.]|nr:hypothetical protein [Ruminococcus sp.]